MADINFDCPFCGQNLDAPEEMAGMELDCPACTRRIQIPSPAAESKVEPAGGIDEDNLPEDLKKSSTIRLNLPSDLGIPPPSRRIVKIKRMGK